MKLNHLDLQVQDVPATVALFERCFGLTLQTSRTSPDFALLGDGHGFVLVLQRSPAPRYPEGFHLGFLVDDVEAVLRVHAQAQAEGLLVGDVDRTDRGTMVYCRMPDGYLVEVSCRRGAHGDAAPPHA